MDHVVTDNIKTNKDQHNDAIENDQKFDNIFNLSSGTKYPIPLVTLSLKGGKKPIANSVSDITFLWDNRATNMMIKQRHSK